MYLFVCYQVEGSLGYGHWVCSMLLHPDKRDNHVYMYAIEQMGAVPVASDALARYTGKQKILHLGISIVTV